MPESKSESPSPEVAEVRARILRRIEEIKKLIEKLKKE